MSDFEDRSVPFELRANAAGDGLTMSGYAAVFNRSTRITGERHRNAPNGTFDEVLAPGAFKRSINAKTPVLMFDHGAHPLIGSMPLGSITQLREDAQGLFVEAKLHDNWLTQPVRDAIASGSVSGMSFRFQVPEGKETWDTSGDIPKRTIHEAKTVELGPVVFPAYAGTSVGVRSLASQLSHLPEDALTNVLDALRSILGTSDGPAVSGTPDEPASETDPASATPDPTPIAVRRRRALELKGLTHNG